ncbi:MAG: hypothetical protein ACREPQ_08240 [Rhodanobacter sp.]
MPTQRIALTIGCLLLACAPTAARAQSAAEWRVLQSAAETKSDKIMAEANTHKGLLAQYQVMRQAYPSDNSPAFHQIFGQYISWYQSFLGDYPEAMDSYSIGQPPLEDDSPSPLTEAGYVAHPALDAIPELARGYRIVLFNEAHNIPLTRSLTVQLLSKLRQEGFNYFAAETLYESDTALQSRGYPIDASGFYTREPVYAEMVRTALKLGFKVIAYEATSDAGGSDARETEQARNIDEQVFKSDPHARMVVNAGYDHIVKSGAYLNGASMAEHLYKLTHIPMLSIEQTMLYPHPLSSGDHPYYTAVMQELRPKVPIVFANAAGKPWSLRPGYDVSVFFPPVQMLHGRPAWLSLGGLRRPYLVSGDRCHMHYPCLVEARYSDEGADAIPADRMVIAQTPLINSGSPVPMFTSNENIPSGDLYLRPGKYQLSMVIEDDKVIGKKSIVVPDAPPSSSGQP